MRNPVPIEEQVRSVEDQLKVNAKVFATALSRSDPRHVERRRAEYARSYVAMQAALGTLTAIRDRQAPLP